MRVYDIQLEHTDSVCELSGRVEAAGLATPLKLWYRFPLGFARLLSARTGDPFLAALLLPALRAGEALEIDAPVSRKLLRTSRTIQEIFCCWDRDMAPIRVSAPLSRWPAILHRRHSAVGLFFSLGVDSFYSLCKNVTEHPAGPDALTHLVFVEGFDMCTSMGNLELVPLARERAERVAQRFGKRLLFVSTNVHDVSDRWLVLWGLAHGAAMASVALAMQGVFRRMLVASGHSYDNVFPAGTHPLLDPLWSTERLQIIHDGCEARRSQKVARIAQFDVALEHLRVCWENPAGAYNCGRCNKCVGTMIRLYLAGALASSGTFPRELDLDLVRTMPLKAKGQREYTEALITDIGESTANAELVSALRDCLARHSPSTGAAADGWTAHAQSGAVPS